MKARRSRPPFLIVLIVLLLGKLCPAKEPVLTYRGNNLRTGSTSNVAATAPALLWNYGAFASIDASPVIGRDGTIYIASTDGYLYSLTQLGALRWSFRAQESIFSTPAIGSDGTIYFGDLAGNYYALNPDGTRKWTYTFTEGSDRRITASPAVSADGVSYVPSWSDQLCSVSAAGKPLWCVKLKGMLSSSPALDPAGNIYVTGQDIDQPTSFAVYKFAPNPPAQVWKFSANAGTDRNRAISTPAIDVQRGRLYAAMTGDATGTLFEIGLSDGRLARRIDFPKGILSSPAIGSDGTIYIGCLDGSLHAINPDTGETRWQFSAPGSFFIGSPTVDGAGNIVMGDSDGIIYGVSPAGKELWRFVTGSNVSSSPTIGDDGKILVASYDSHVYALGDSPGENLFYFPQVADGTSGSAAFRTTFFLANTGSDARFKLEFYDSGGRVMPVALGDLGTDWSFAVSLKRGESFSAQTAAATALRSGYARVTAGTGIGGTAVYSYAEKSLTMFEAGAPAAATFNRSTLFVNSGSESRATALALVNAGAQTAHTTLHLYDATFNHLADKSVSSILGADFEAGTHMARYAGEIFPEIAQQQMKSGVITLESDQPLSCVTLQQNDSALPGPPGHVLNMSAFPVIPESAESNPVPGGPGVLYFPQIAAGSFGEAQAQTSIVLINTGGETDALVEFFDEAGQPSKVSLLQETTAASSFGRHLKPGQSVILETTDSGPGWVGYARVTTTSRVGGTAVLKWSADGVRLFEAGIPAASGQKEFSVGVDTTPGYSTGLALVNVGPSPATVTMRLYDKSSRLIVERNLAEVAGGRLLNPGAHLSKYAFEFFGEIAATGLSQGLIGVYSDQPLAAVTLRQRDDPGKNFPDDIFIMSLFPVIAGAPAR